MRVAYASPLPPSGSGIADYSADLVRGLDAAGVGLDLFYEGSRPPTGALAERFRCRPVRELRRLAGGYDLVLYHLGNSLPHHAQILDTLLEVPGAVVLHEFMLHHLIRERTLAAGDAEGYVEEMRYCAGETGRRAARRLLDTHYPVDVWSFPLFERVVDRSRGVVVHSEFARRRVLASRPAARVEAAPFPVDLDELATVSAGERAGARASLGPDLEVDPDAFVLGSFGFVTPQKRLEPALAAFARLRRERPDALFLVAGEVSPHYDLDAVLETTGREGVVLAGRLDLDRFHAAMRACDVAVNLRHPTGGETSAALLRLMALGVPSIVTRTGSFAELPAGVAAQVAVDEHEEELLLELYRALAADTGLRAQMSAAARRHVESVHALPVAAARWTEALAALAGSANRVAAPVPPLAPWDGVDPRVALTAAVGAEMADLAVGENDRDLLGAIAAVLDELDLGPRRQGA